MWMESREKFRSPQDIPGASQQNSIIEFWKDTRKKHKVSPKVSPKVIWQDNIYALFLRQNLYSSYWAKRVDARKKETTKNTNVNWLHAASLV